MDEIQIDKSRVEWRRVEDEIVALDLGQSDYFTLNATGSALWNRLVEGATSEQLVQELIDQFDVDQETASRDVTDFLKSLEDRGLLAQGGA